MAPSQPLKGIALIDCARANAKQGIHVATKLCGYGDNLNEFESELKQACQDIGVEIQALTELISESQRRNSGEGIEIAPNTYGRL